MLRAFFLAASFVPAAHAGGYCFGPSGDACAQDADCPMEHGYSCCGSKCIQAFAALNIGDVCDETKPCGEGHCGEGDCLPVEGGLSKCGYQAGQFRLPETCPCTNATAATTCGTAQNYRMCYDDKCETTSRFNGDPCATDDMCDSLGCSGGGVCMGIGNGSPCSHTLKGNPCKDGFYCDVVCTASPAAGAMCTRKNECADDGYCLGETTKTCVAKASIKEGSPCSESYSDMCAASGAVLYCDTTSTAPLSKCAAKKTTNAVCVENKECLRNLCIDQQCVDSVGVACTTDGQECAGSTMCDCATMKCVAQPTKAEMFAASLCKAETDALAQFPNLLDRDFSILTAPQKKIIAAFMCCRSSEYQGYCPRAFLNNYQLDCEAVEMLPLDNMCDPTKPRGRMLNCDKYPRVGGEVGNSASVAHTVGGPLLAALVLATLWAK